MVSRLQQGVAEVYSLESALAHRNEDGAILHVERFQSPHVAEAPKCLRLFVGAPHEATLDDGPATGVDDSGAVTATGGIEESRRAEVPWLGKQRLRRKEGF